MLRRHCRFHSGVREQNTSWGYDKTGNAEYLYVRRSPAGALSLPVQVGGNGATFYSSFMVNF